MRQLDVWAFGDTQPQNAEQWAKLDQVVADVKANMPFHLGIAVGDLVHNGQVSSDFDLYKQRILNLNHSKASFLMLAGNHEFQNDNTLTNYRARIQREIAFSQIYGNLLFILMSDESNHGPGEQNISDSTFNWWLDLVEKNKDKIIIVATHAALANTTKSSNSAGYQIKDSQRFIDVLDAGKHTVNLWLHGHIPITLQQANMIVEKHGVLQMNVGLHIPWPFNPCSRLIRFRQGKDIVKIRLRNHATRSFDDKYEYSFRLNRAINLHSPDDDGIRNRLFWEYHN